MKVWICRCVIMVVFTYFYGDLGKRVFFVDEIKVFLSQLLKSLYGLLMCISAVMKGFIGFLSVFSGIYPLKRTFYRPKVSISTFFLK